MSSFSYCAFPFDFKLKPLKQEFQRELNLPRGQRTCYLPRRRCTQPSCGEYGCVWFAEIWVVVDVVGFSPGNQSHAFTYCSGLLQIYVDVFEAWPNQGVPANVPIETHGLQHETRRVEVLIRIYGSGIFRIVATSRSQIGSDGVVPRLIPSTVYAIEDGKWSAVGKGSYSTKAPTAYQPVAFEW